MQESRIVQGGLGQIEEFIVSIIKWTTEGLGTEALNEAERLGPTVKFGLRARNRTASCVESGASLISHEYHQNIVVGTK